MVASREPREIAGFRYDEIINAIDWNRVMIQARGLHLGKHNTTSYSDVCGECIKSVLLRVDQDESSEQKTLVTLYKENRKKLHGFFT